MQTSCRETRDQVAQRSQVSDTIPPGIESVACKFVGRTTCVSLHDNAFLECTLVFRMPMDNGIQLIRTGLTTARIQHLSVLFQRFYEESMQDC